MDDTIEPIIVILGDPVAGNPSQLALERGLETLNLSYRVLSMNVAGKDLVTAVNGLDVCGVRAILLDPILARSQRRDTNSYPIDFYIRDTSGFHQVSLRSDLQNEFVRQYDRVEGESDIPLPQSVARSDPDNPNAELRSLWICDERSIGQSLSESIEFSARENEPIAVDVLLTSERLPWNVSQLNDVDSEAIRRIHLPIEFEIEFLAEAFRRLTGQPIASEIIADAMEEYQSV